MVIFIVIRLGRGSSPYTVNYLSINNKCIAQVGGYWYEVRGKLYHGSWFNCVNDGIPGLLHVGRPSTGEESPAGASAVETSISLFTERTSAEILFFSQDWVIKNPNYISANCQSYVRSLLVFLGLPADLADR